MTNAERAEAWWNKDAELHEHASEDEIGSVERLLNEAESRGRAEVQAELDEANGLLKRWMEATTRGALGSVAAARQLTAAYDARAAAKKGG